MFRFFSGVFLQDPVTFPPLSGGIHPYPEAGSIDLGTDSVQFPDILQYANQLKTYVR
jgi:hypothetical protein